MIYSLVPCLFLFLNSPLLIYNKDEKKKNITSTYRSKKNIKPKCQSHFVDHRLEDWKAEMMTEYTWLNKQRYNREWNIE